MADASAAVTLARSYEPFGTTLSESGAGETVWQFTGETRDASGLTFLRARYLSTVTGRFMTNDPWGGAMNMPLSYNDYLYVYANPLNWIDRSGFSPELDFCDNVRNVTELEECRNQIRGIETGWHITVATPTGAIVAALIDALCVDGILPLIATSRTVTGIVSGRGQTGSNAVISATYNPFSAAKPDIYTGFTIRRADDQSVAIRLLVSELHDRLVKNQYNGLEGVIILLTGYNRTRYKGSQPPYAYCGDESGGYYSLASCLGAPEGYALVNHVAGQRAELDTLESVANDPFCINLPSIDCRNSWDGGRQTALKALDTAALIYELFQQVTGYHRDDYQDYIGLGATEWRHRCQNPEYGKPDPDPNGCPRHAGPAVLLSLESSRELIVHYCDTSAKTFEQKGNCTARPAYRVNYAP